MQKSKFRKGLVVVVIVLFVGTSVISIIGGNFTSMIDDTEMDILEYDELTSMAVHDTNEYIYDFENEGKYQEPELDIHRERSNNRTQSHEKESSQFERGNTLYVGGNGTGNYSTIQHAIDDASNGDTVYVYDDSSPYYEQIIIDKSILLIGEDNETTIIDGDTSQNILWEKVIDIKNDNIKIYKFTLRNALGDTDMGLSCEDYDNIHIDNCIIHSCYNGINIFNSEKFNITNNIFTNNENKDIQDYFSSKNHIIKGCSFSNSNQSSISYDVENGSITNIQFCFYAI